MKLFVIYKWGTVQKTAGGLSSKDETFSDNGENFYDGVSTTIVASKKIPMAPPELTTEHSPLPENDDDYDGQANVYNGDGIFFTTATNLLTPTKSFSTNKISTSMIENFTTVMEIYRT